MDRNNFSKDFFFDYSAFCLLGLCYLVQEFAEVFLQERKKNDD